MKRFFLLAIVLITLAIVLSACGEKVEPECAVDTDCKAVGTCSVAQCVEGMCRQTIKQNCCGNNQCEDKAGENPCSCEADCTLEATPSGKCEGKLELPHPRYSDRTIDADYLAYLCENNACVLGVPEDEVEERQLFYQSDSRADVEFEIVTTVSQPYVVEEGLFKLRIKLFEHASSIQLPIRVKDFKMLMGSELITEKTVSYQFTKIGDVYEVILDLKPILSSAESTKSVQLLMNYEYIEIDRDGIQQLRRREFSKEWKELEFVDPSRAETN